MPHGLESVPGDVGFYYKNLATGETEAFQPDLPLVAASVIKLPLMIEAFRQFEAGLLDPDAPVTVLNEQKVPSCGVLTYLHGGLTVTVRDLVTLSIIVSDNTATNLLFDLVGADNVNRTLAALGAEKTRLRRKMFDRESARRGIQNTITAGEVGAILEGLYRGEVVSKEASEAMIGILKDQQLNGKIPFYFCEGIEIAHKTGEDDGTTHDVAIVYADEPFVLCLCSNHVDVPPFERRMQDIAKGYAHV